MIVALVVGLLAAGVYLFLLAVADGILVAVVAMLLLAGLAVGGWIALVVAVRDDDIGPTRQRWRRRGAETRPWPQRLVMLQGVLLQSADSAGAEHQRLRPLLRDIASERVGATYGFVMDADPARSSALLGALAWELLRPDRPWPEDRRAPGRGLAQLSAVVDAIEEVGGEGAGGHAG